MTTIDLSLITKLFTGGQLAPPEKQNLLKEALLLTLSRASRSDTNIHHVEVSTIQKILQDTTGEAFSEADIRVAAHSELYESGTLEAYLGSVTKALDEQDRALIAKSLADVIKSDAKVTYQEVAFFNSIASALKLTPATMVGLITD